MKTLEITLQDHIAIVRINRPAQGNAIILDTFTDLLEAAALINSNREVRVAVLTGSGKNFCAGLDMSLMPTEEGALDWFEQHGFIDLDSHGANIFQRSVIAWQELRVPSIAAINGVAYGGGFQIAMGTDMRVVDASSRLSLRETYWGLIPDMAMTYTLPRLLPRDIAADLLLSARIVDGEEARALGLATRFAANCLDEAMAMAADIAQKSPQAIEAAKRLYRLGWERPPAHALSLEASLQHALLGSRDQVETARANFEGRSPVFGDR